MSPAIITLIVLAIVVVALITDKLPLAATACAGAFALAILGVIDKKDVLSAASGSTCVLLGATMIIGGAIFHSGLADKVSQKIVKLTGTTENGIMIAIMIVALFFSSVCSGTSVVAMMLPIVVAMCLKANVPLSRNLVILSFASSIGCNLTLVGAASNVSTAGMIEAMGIPFLGFFDLGKVGLPLCAIFAVYFLTIGRKTMVKPHPHNQEYADELLATNKVAQENFNLPKAILTAVILVITFVAMGLNNDALPMYFVASLGCLILIVCGVMTTKQAAHSIDWDTIFIVTGMSAITKAMSESGAAQLIADFVVNLLGNNPNKYLVLFVVLVTTMLLTNVMMNTSAVLVVTPIFVPIAVAFGVNPVAVGVAICIAASAPFLTPVGSPTNTMCVNPGNLEFMDFFKPGLGLSILTVVVGMVLIPIFWPLAV